MGDLLTYSIWIPIALVILLLFLALMRLWGAPSSDSDEVRERYRNPVSAKLAQYQVRGDYLYDYNKRVLLKDAQIEIIDPVGRTERMTATRIVGGAVLAGPVGAILGGMAKKSTGKMTIIVFAVDGQQMILEFPAERAHEAHVFAAQLARIADGKPLQL